MAEPIEKGHANYDALYLVWVRNNKPRQFTAGSRRFLSIDRGAKFLEIDANTMGGTYETAAIRTDRMPPLTPAEMPDLTPLNPEPDEKPKKNAKNKE